MNARYISRFMAAAMTGGTGLGILVLLFLASVGYVVFSGAWRGFLRSRWVCHRRPRVNLLFEHAPDLGAVRRAAPVPSSDVPPSSGSCFPTDNALSPLRRELSQ